MPHMEILGRNTVRSQTSGGSVSLVNVKGQASLRFTPAYKELDQGPRGSNGSFHLPASAKPLGMGGAPFGSDGYFGE